jgi:hypothetical protein
MRPSDGVVPLAFAHAAVEGNDAAHQCKEERQRAVRHLLDAVVGDVADPDPAIGRGRRVDVVVTDRARRDDAERWQPAELGSADRLIRADKECDDVIPLPRRVGLLDLGEIPKDLCDLLEHVVGVGDENPHASPSP